MAQQIVVIGLGHFGMALAKNLAEKGVEVLAVDKDRDRIEDASAYFAEALAFDASDESELARLDLSRRDAAVCAMGDKSREASIICTALLKQMGCPYIVARASDSLHQRILTLVGANLVINPDKEFGRRFANKLIYRHAIVDTNLWNELNLAEIRVQPFMVGKSLIELALPKLYGVFVVGIRNLEDPRIKQPLPNQALRADETLLIVSKEEALPQILKG